MSHDTLIELLKITEAVLHLINTICAHLLH